MVKEQQNEELAHSLLCLR